MTKPGTKYFSIIDLGTGTIRNTIFDYKGNVIECLRSENPVIYPKPGWAEQNTALWWKILMESYHKLSPIVRKNIYAVSVTSQREGIVPVNTDFEPLDNMIIWLDERTGKEAKFIAETLGKDVIYDICGLVPHPVWSLSKILWLKKNKPDIYGKTYKLLQAEDYYLTRLSGRAVTEFSIASRTCLLDVKQKIWSEEILRTFDIDKNKLPELLEPGTLIGKINKKTAKEFQLSNSVAIYTGAGDQQAAALGTGAVFEGSVSIGIGTSSALSFNISVPVSDKSKNIILNCSAIPGMWEYEPPIWNTGGLVKWYFDQLENESTIDYKAILEKTENIAPGSDGLIALPYFSGSGSPRWNPKQKGLFYGLSLSHNKYHLLKALMESIAFEIKMNVDSVKDSGVKINNIILSGGASQNLPLCNIIADVLQLAVEISAETEASTKGCFILLKAALEGTRDYRGVFLSLKSDKSVIEPKSENADIYKNTYKKYRNLGDLFDKFPI